MDQDEIKKRQESEKIFHNKKFNSTEKKDYYALGFTDIIFNDMISQLGNIENKKVLEYGCGAGWLTKTLASKGAEVWTFDISQEAVAMTKAMAESHNFKHKVHVDQMGAEKLTYQENMFDLIVGKAILHHLDLAAGVKEMNRVLKAKGRAYFMEPLGHNPFLNIYRALTPRLRSKDEIPMRFEQFTLIKKSFSKFEHEEYYLTTIFALFWYFFGMNNLMIKTRDLLLKLDRAILRAFPAMKKYCWYSVLVIEK